MSEPVKCVSCARAIEIYAVVCEGSVITAAGIVSCDARACGFDCLRQHRVVKHGGTTKRIGVPGTLSGRRRT